MMSTKTTMKMSMCSSEKKDMNCEMGSSGSAFCSSSLSCTHPNIPFTSASCTHTESTVSSGSTCTSATTSWAFLFTAKESVGRSLSASSGNCRVSMTESADTTKLKFMV